MTTQYTSSLPPLDTTEWDYVIVGSGFGGSVAALRLAQKGYRVAVIEAGRRWRDDDFPTTNWDSKNSIWAPKLGWTGPGRWTFLRHALVLSWAGVGGGSLLYGNTLFRPTEGFFNHPDVARLGPRADLDACFDLATRMLGVATNPHMTQPDHWLREVAAEYGRADTFTPSPVAIQFKPRKNEAHFDPYFEGEGPTRGTCSACGGCFIGCRENAKNTLEKNYLYFAEKLGVAIYPETEVCDIAQLGDAQNPSYRLTTRHGTDLRTQWFGGETTQVYTKNIVIAAGVTGTMKLLLALKATRFPQISDRLGRDVMTNGETLLGVRVDDPAADLSRGIAASSSVFPDEHTQIQVDRFPTGANALALTMTVMVDGDTPTSAPRWLRWLGLSLRHPIKFLQTMRPANWAKQSMILVVMQTLESSLRVTLKDGKLKSHPGDGPLAPTWIPLGNDFARRLARLSRGKPLTAIFEALFNLPATAHVLGGCKMGDSAADSVLDRQNQVHGLPGVMVCDGSMITNNLGVNPALSITALAERAMSFIPPKDGASVKNFAFERDWPEAAILFREANTSSTEART
jgi:cholesterol oxidase